MDTTDAIYVADQDLSINAKKVFLNYLKVIGPLEKVSGQEKKN